MYRSKRGPMLLLVGLALLVPLFTSTGAGAAPSPPGNNGTVKVEGAELDRLHDNDPHVGCQFFVQWYGFDAGTRTATVTFTAQAPTGSGEALLTDTFTFEGSGSGNALDAQRPYDLTQALAGYTPQAQQGFHVKLTVETDVSHGADEKHKVFWVRGCTLRSIHRSMLLRVRGCRSPSHHAPCSTSPKRVNVTRSKLPSVERGGQVPT